jgi:FkbM family methyltransferase
LPLLIVLVCTAAIIWPVSQSLKCTLAIPSLADGQLASSSGGGRSAVDRYVAKGMGEKWKVWDRRSVLHPDLGGTCNWHEFRASGRHREAGTAPVFMCLYPRSEDVYVSGSIEGGGHWEDCDVLTEMLSGPVADKGAAVYMDIGANIGACVMQVLFSTNASILAFEPNPRNLFRLTSTLMHLPEEMKDRVALFPVALGDEPAMTSIVTTPDNAGNTQVRRSEGDKLQGGGAVEGGASVEAQDIPVEMLDDLLSPDLHTDIIK